MKSIFFSLALLLFLPSFLFSQISEVITSGEALYNSTYSLTNGVIMGATIESNSKNKGTKPKRTVSHKLCK